VQSIVCTPHPKAQLSGKNKESIKVRCVFVLFFLSVFFFNLSFARFYLIQFQDVLYVSCVFGRGCGVGLFFSYLSRDIPCFDLARKHSVMKCSVYLITYLRGMYACVFERDVSCVFGQGCGVERGWTRDSPV